MPKKFPKDERSRTASTSSQRSRDSHDRPLRSESEDPIELLSPKHNGNSVDSLKPHNKSSIKGMWKKAFRSIRSNKPKDEKDKAEGDRDSKHSRTPLNRSGSKDFEKQPKDESKTASQSSRQSSLKRVLRRKDSKEEKQEEEYSRDEDPVYMTLKRAQSIAVPSSSLSGTASMPGDLDIVDEEFEDYDDDPFVQPSSSSAQHHQQQQQRYGHHDYH